MMEAFINNNFVFLWRVIFLYGKFIKIWTLNTINSNHFYLKNAIKQVSPLRIVP